MSSSPVGSLLITPGIGLISLASIIVISVVLNLVFYLIRRFF